MKTVIGLLVFLACSSVSAQSPDRKMKAFEAAQKAKLSICESTRKRLAEIPQCQEVYEKYKKSNCTGENAAAIDREYTECSQRPNIGGKKTSNKPIGVRGD